MACQSTDTSLNEFTDEDFSFLDTELEALQSIFINELEIKEDEKFTTISIDLYPATADKLDEQYVRMTLEFILNEEYPEEIPEIKIRNPRGLSDEELKSIFEDLSMIAESKRGNSMLFEMIDAAKEHLTVGNRPSEECAICLHGFSDNDVFTKTECYHYFHSHCLARYAKNFFDSLRSCEDDAESKSKSDELLCPMCRIPIHFDDWDFDYPPPEESDENNFTLSEEMIELQKKMASLFEKQVKKGGIIDIEAEKNKYLLEISSVPTRLNNEEKNEEKVVAEGDSITETKNEQSDEVNCSTSDRKEYVNDDRDHSKKTDYRPRNRNFNRPYENRTNNRYDYRYNRQPFNRNNYNKYRYGKQNLENSTPDEPVAKDSSVHQNLTEKEDLVNSIPDKSEHDDAQETSDYPSPNSRVKYSPNFSPRYKNRGYHHGRNNYHYDNNRQSGKYGYNERRGGSQTSHRYSMQRAEESANKYEKRNESDFATQDDDNSKTGYKSGSYKHDNDYYTKQRYPDSRNSSHDYSGKQRYGDNRNNSHEHYTKQRYSDNRNNSYHGFRGAYSKREGYSNSYNSRSNKYTESKNRDQYPERNYKEKWTQRDMKYKTNDDTGYNRSRQGTRNYTGSRPERYSDRLPVEPSNESKSSELNNENQNGDHDNSLLSENGSLSKSNSPPESSQKEKSVDKKEIEKVEEKCPDTVSSYSSSSSNILPNAFGENSDVGSRTVKPPPGFANPLKKVVYGLQGANPPPGFNRS